MFWKTQILIIDKKIEIKKNNVKRKKRTKVDSKRTETIIERKTGYKKLEKR